MVGRRSLLVHEPVLLDNLTPRELEILTCIVAGMENAQIAVALDASIHTIRMRCVRIYAALGVRDRTAAAVYALTGVLPHNAMKPVLKAGQLRRRQRLEDEASSL